LPTKRRPNKKPVKRKYKISTERNGALHELQRYKVELEMSSNGYNRCITCGRIVNDAQGGHFIPRTHRATELEEDNVNAQCPRCNMEEGGRQLIYRDELAKKIGEERVERLINMYRASLGSEEAFERLEPEDQRKISYRKTASDYHEIRIKYKHLRKELKERRGW